MDGKHGLETTAITRILENFGNLVGMKVFEFGSVLIPRSEVASYYMQEKIPLHQKVSQKVHLTLVTATWFEYSW